MKKVYCPKVRAYTWGNPTKTTVKEPARNEYRCTKCGEVHTAHDHHQ